MQADADVLNVGTDTSGRTIYMTRYMRDVWEQIVADLGWRPTIVQGAFMVRNGGGASASAGYHDGGGSLDVRTWDMGDRLETFIRTTRRYGFPFWRRDSEHGGMDPHAHGVLGTDYALTSGAAYQWQQYLAGRDGLASNGPDYEWRPSPLVTRPPEDEDMADYADQLDRIEQQNATILKRLDNDAAIRNKLSVLVKQGRADSRDLKALQDALDERKGK